MAVKKVGNTAEVQVIKKKRARASAKLESEAIEIPNISSDTVESSLNRTQQTELIHKDYPTAKQAPPTQPLTKSISTILCIPAHNEEKQIGPLIIKAKKFVDQIIVCDDGSEDSTGEIAKGLGATVIRHETSLGRIASLRTLFELSQELDPAMILVIDVDPRHDVSEIPKIVSTIKSGTADVAFGAQKINDNRIDQLLTADKDDLHSVFMGFSRKALKAFLLAPPDALESYSKIVGMAQDNLLYFKDVQIKALSEANEILSVPQTAEAELPPTSDVQPQLIMDEPSKSEEGIYQRLITTLTDKSVILLGLPGLLSLAIGVLAGAYLIMTFLSIQYLSLPVAFVMVTGVISGLLLCVTSVILASLSRLKPIA